jgi:predicted AAA+ superfamily ATPase
MELKKQCTWSKTQPRCYHFRNQTNQEVDLVLENRAGQIVGIEIKASSSVTHQDFKGLIALSETANHEFLQGIVIYTGNQVIPFGKNLWAIPIGLLYK